MEFCHTSIEKGRFSMSKVKKNIFYVTIAMLLMAMIFSNISFSKNAGQIYALTSDPTIGAKAYYLYDQNANTVLAEKDCESHFEIASMVKLMTSLLTIEKIEKNEWSLKTELHVSDYAASMEGSQAFLDAGKSYKIDDLLKSVIVASANDSSVVLAENYAGTENNFVDAMNTKANELGLSNTLYANSTGLPSATAQYSCAKDVAKLLGIVSKHDLYKKYCKIWMDKLVHSDGRVTELVNTNRLSKYYPGCVCGKTGFTDEAGYCLSVLAEKNNMNLISVVMGAKTSNERFSNSINLLNYGFSNFKDIKIVDSAKQIATGQKLKGSKDEIVCKPKYDLIVVERNGIEKSEYTVKKTFVNFPKHIKSGDIVGKIIVSKNGSEICQTDLLSEGDYNQASFGDLVHNIIDNWSL